MWTKITFGMDAVDMMVDQRRYEPHLFFSIENVLIVIQTKQGL